VQEMRLRIGAQIRYPDVVICAAPLAQTTRTLTDVVGICSTRLQHGHAA